MGSYVGMQFLNPLMGREYSAKVLALKPIAYWPLWEVSGGIAYDISGNNRNGAYTAVTLGQAGIGDGRTCPYFDGANGYVNIYSVSLSAAWSWATGSILLWGKVFNVGVWNDGSSDIPIYIGPNSNNRRYISKPSLAGGRLDYFAVNNAVVNSYQGQAMTNSVGWWCLTQTWNLPTTTWVAYFNGVQVDTENVMGVGVGALGNTTTVIGASSTVPVLPWYGYIAHVALWNRELTAGQVMDISKL